MCSKYKHFKNVNIYINTNTHYKYEQVVNMKERYDYEHVVNISMWYVL